MERGSDKHGPRLDDEMSREVSSLTTGAPVEARSREERLKEAPSEEEPGTEVGGRPGMPAGGSISPEAAIERADLARRLAGARFPAEPAELVEAARRDGAPDDVVSRLAGLPAGGAYANVEAVWEALGGARERR